MKLTVNKATLTVTANNATRPFGTGNPAFTLTYKGFVNGESEANLTSSPPPPARQLPLRPWEPTTLP